ncbi:MAG: hypothetical protein D8B49_04140 [Riemerella sp.]|nr:MAG: hypothetical protein D8B49_04140 [Riemerella sp.]
MEFITKTDSIYKKEKRDFIYLNEKTDLSAAKIIGKIKANGKADWYMLFYSIMTKAQKLGANAFKYSSSSEKGDISELIIDNYLISEEIKADNKEFLPKNKIYFFGRHNKKGTTEEFKLNGKKTPLKAFHYAVYNLDKDTQINKGGFLGTTLNISPNPSGRSYYMNFSGFGPSAVMTGSLSFTAGNIIQMDENYSLLLTHIYQLQE